jgi:hypothetical protein
MFMSLPFAFTRWLAQTRYVHTSKYEHHAKAMAHVEFLLEEHVESDCSEKRGKRVEIDDEGEVDIRL